MSITVSVIVPTCGRARLLERCLDALLAQDLEPSRYEVIVVDDGQGPEEKRPVEALCARRAKPRVRCLASSGRQGPAAARNLGLGAAQGAVVAFTDDDCVPATDWLTKGLQGFSGNAAGVSGKIIVPVPPVPTDYELSIARLEQAEFATANCFYRRDVLLKAGGFDERFTAAWREDADVFFILLEAGNAMVFSPDAVVVHPVRPAPWGVSIREQKKSLFNALLYKKHPRLYRERLQNFPPFRYYAAVTALGLSLAALASGRPRHALAAAGAWLALSAHFCARRLRDTAQTPSHRAEMAVTSALIPPLSLFWRLAGALKYRVPFL
ncbi:MAG: glycosyltransferase family 2 protein [Endomicrobiales bacterium]